MEVASCLVVCCVTPGSVTWIEISKHRPRVACDPTFPVSRPFCIQLILFVHLCWFLPINQATAQGHFNLWPLRDWAAEVYQSDVNPSVFCSHFNGDQELSFGNSFSAWEKALLPFNVNEVVVEFLLGDQKRVTEADVHHSPVGEAGFSIHHHDRRHFEMKFLHNIED